MGGAAYGYGNWRRSRHGAGSRRFAVITGLPMPLLCGGGDPGRSGCGFGEGFEGTDAVLGCGGQVRTDGAEVLRAGDGAHAAGDLDAQFAHADLALGGVVVEGHAGIAGEPQVVVFAL